MRDACDDYLLAQSVVEALSELPPELGRHLFVEVQTHQNLRCLILLERVLDAVGYVCRYAHLSLQGHIHGACHLLQMLEQASALLLVLLSVDVVVDHVECHDTLVALWIAHHHCQRHQVVGIFGVLHGYEYLLVVGNLQLLVGVVVLVEAYVACRILGQYG